MVGHLSGVCKDLGFHPNLEKKQREEGKEREEEGRREEHIC